MLIPMEILSPQTTRTDSGAGVRNTSRSGNERNSSSFEKVMENELSRHDQKMLRRNSDSSGETGSNPPAEKVETVTVQNKDEEIDKNGESLAAGVMGNHTNEIVFILEGDKESVANPEMRVETVTPPDEEQIINPEVKQETTETAENSQQNKFSLEPEKTGETQTVLHANETGKEITKSVAVETNNTNTAGEVTARMPEIRTGDNTEYKESNENDLSRNGNLSPLENKNDKSEKTGQENKLYSAIEEAGKNKPEEPVNEIIAPLSDGIKPEQFKAAQQMTQAASNAPVKPENLFQEMIDRVETMQSDTKSTMTIQLNPEFLGKVALEITTDAAGIHVKIDAQDSGVRGMINGQLTALIESLENKGIAVSTVEVIYTGINFGTHKETSEDNQGQQGSRNQARNREINTKDAVTYYATLPDLMDYYMDTGISSVEFSA